MEDENTQSAEITNATGTSPITGDSPPDCPHHEESAEDAETTASDSIPPAGESSRGKHRNPLRDRRPPIKGRRDVVTVIHKLPYHKELYSYFG